VITERSAVKEKDVLKKIDRWKKIALNSIKQCRRLYPVEILNLKKEKIKKVKSVAVFVGPEGGITDRELDILSKKGFRSASLGDYILKMETAVIVGVCQVNFVYR